LNLFLPIGLSGKDAAHRSATDVEASEEFRLAEAGPRVAAILSVIESCRRLKIPVRDYLADILPGLANAPVQRIAHLTPAVWAAKKSAMQLV
jgi:hypothetical protein